MAVSEVCWIWHIPAITTGRDCVANVAADKIANKVRRLTGMGMFPRLSCRFIAALMLVASCVRPALAQVIPSSELPGRARDDIQQQQRPPRSAPAAPQPPAAAAAPRGAEAVERAVTAGRDSGGAAVRRRGQIGASGGAGDAGAGAARRATKPLNQRRPNNASTIPP